MINNGFDGADVGLAEQGDALTGPGCRVLAGSVDLVLEADPVLLHRRRGAELPEPLLGAVHERRLLLHLRQLVRSLGLHRQRLPRLILRVFFREKVNKKILRNRR